MLDFEAFLHILVHGEQQQHEHQNGNAYCCEKFFGIPFVKRLCALFAFG
jgi:hypothetical protein